MHKRSTADHLSVSILALVLAAASGCSTPGSGPVAAGGTGDDGAATVDAGPPADTSGTGGVDSTPDVPPGDVPEADAGPVADAVPSDASSPPDTGSAAPDVVEEPDVPPTPDVPPQPDVPPKKVCSVGETKCSGAKLASCGPYEDGWIVSSCFPGLTCAMKNGAGTCVPVSNNLIIVFDSSGSMTAKVPGCSLGGSPSWPTCDPNKDCSRMGRSKVTFKKALAKIDDQVTRMALFRFPQKLRYKSTTSCTSGYYQGQSVISGETTMGGKDKQSVNDASSWYWDTLNETLCVPFPKSDNTKTKAAILKWMDGTGKMLQQGGCTSSSSYTCAPQAGCAGTCCPGNKCMVNVDPELRPTGGTPIGKTLFYVGEYLRNRVVIDGKPCKATADCNNVNYVCKQDGKTCETPADGCTSGKCIDPARSCRNTIVMLFTDGGQGNSNTYFAPWMQAKRLGFGLGCQTDDDCVGGAKCKLLPGTVQKHCRRDITITDYYCSADMSPCITDAVQGQEGFCSKECVRDPLSYQFNDPKSPNYFKAPLTAVATNPADNVLRSPDGKPFGVRLYVVDISAASSLKNSMSLALAGNGKLLGTDASDPDNFLKTLDKVFDIKNLKVCGQTM